MKYCIKILYIFVLLSINSYANTNHINYITVHRGFISFGVDTKHPVGNFIYFNMHSNFIDIKGEKFGKLTVLYFIPWTKEKQGRWKCQCDCGKLTEVRGTALRKGQIKSCGCLVKIEGATWARLQYGEAALNKVIRQYKKNALERGKSFELSKEQFKEITQKKCYYCGSMPNNQHNSNKTYGKFKYNGIDRIDNNLGYVYDNCVPCCSECNWIKSDLSLEEFKNKIRVLYNNLFSKLTL